VKRCSQNGGERYALRLLYFKVCCILKIAGGQDLFQQNKETAEGGAKVRERNKEWFDEK
jgi:hypothetical protein